MMDVDQAAKDIQDAVKKNINTFLLNFFGSMENAQVLGKYYFLERNSDLPHFKVDFADDNNVRYYMTDQYRIRKKTDEELKAAGIIEPLNDAIRRTYNHDQTSN